MMGLDRQPSFRPGRRIAVVGPLGIHPMSRLSLPARRVLAFLALSDGAASRAYAAGTLWPNERESAARANLRRSLWQVPDGWVDCVGEELRMNAEVDYPAAREVAATALDGGRLTLAEISLLSEDLLPGWHEDWTASAQDSFRMLRIDALEAACRTLAAEGAYGLATQAGMAAITAEPLRESAAEALVAAHLLAGNRYAAARCFADFSNTLREELGVEPNPTLVNRLIRVGLLLSRDRRMVSAVGASNPFGHAPSRDGAQRGIER
jgi:DNA-binding SARP family transcriptional activator